MLPMRLFRHRSFSIINVASLLMFLGMFGSIFLLSQYLQTVGGYSPMQTGVRMLPWTAMPMFAGPLAGALSDRIGGGSVVAVGMALNAAGLGLWALAVEPQVLYTHLQPALIVCGIGRGMFFAPSANLVMSTEMPGRGRALYPPPAQRGLVRSEPGRQRARRMRGVAPARLVPPGRRGSGRPTAGAPSRLAPGPCPWG
jgi:predicted MFS family arabinose efflux permease